VRSGMALAHDRKMKAIVQDGYGSPDVLELRAIETPVVGDNQVLVRVRGASVNAADWHLLQRLPHLVGRMLGMPRSRVRGGDVAGHVEAVGKNVRRFRPGDEVFGVGIGTFAEYATAFEDRLAPKPRNLTFEQAAAIPCAGCTALQGLRDKGQVKAGQRVLIYGAGGGVGTFAVQIAKSLGAFVTAVTSTRNLDLVHSIGADEAIDYTREDFTRRAQRYDVLFDIGANRSFADCRRVLAPNGTLVLAGAPSGLLRGHLGGVGRRLARSLEPHRASRRPHERVAVLVGDVDDRVVETGGDVRFAVEDVPPLPATRLLLVCQENALLLLGDLLLPRDGPTGALAGTSIGVSPLAVDRQSPTMTGALIRTDLDLTLDVLCNLAAQVALDAIVGVDELPDPGDLVVGQIPDLGVGVDLQRHQQVLGAAPPHPKDVGEADLDSLVSGKVNPGNTRHASPLSLLVSRIGADDPDTAVAADDATLLAHLLGARSYLHGGLSWAHASGTTATQRVGLRGPDDGCRSRYVVSGSDWTMPANTPNQPRRAGPQE